MLNTKSEKGKKRVCINCSTRWYDLNKEPIICPICKQEFELNDSYIVSYSSTQSSNKSAKSTEDKPNKFNSENDINEVEDIDNSEANEDADLISLEEVEKEPN